MASLLGISPRNLRKEALDGGIPYVRVGADALLFDAERVLEVLRSRARHEGGAPASSGVTHDLEGLAPRRVPEQVGNGTALLTTEASDER